MIEENGQMVKCPKCQSENVNPVHPFDYWKQCNNDNCKYYLESPEKYRYQFSTGIHN